jgi:hypothetical protein
VSFGALAVIMVCRYVLPHNPFHTTMLMKDEGS